MLVIRFSPFPELETERILLRKVVLQDAQDLFELRSNVAAMKYVPKPPAQTIDEAIQLINKIDTALEQNEGIAWGVILKENNKLIGHLGYHRIYKEDHRAELGYMIAPEHWNKGLITEAIRPIIHYAFTTMKLHSIEAKINPENKASQKVLIKLNFVKEAHFKEDHLHNGVFTDTEVYSLLSNTKC